ncbi:MAG: DUF2950 family protein [Planctomycetota bacterium]
MKHACILTALLLFAPAQDDDLEKKVEKLEKRIAALEKKLDELNELVELLKTIRPVLDATVTRMHVTQCANNLSFLWKMQLNYMVIFGGTMKAMPTETGAAFWLKLTTTGPPLIDADTFDKLVCPGSREKPRAGFCNYRGPASDVNPLGDDGIVGGCEPGHHPDGVINVLFKSGEIVTLTPDDRLYDTALEKTKGVFKPEKKKERGEAPPGMNEFMAKEMFKALPSAQVDFRANERDGNGVYDFWVGDISGLYRCLGKDGKPIKLISEIVAQADARPLKEKGLAKHLVEEPVPCSGYFFVALKNDQEGNPYDDGSRRNGGKFGIAIYPAKYGETGKRTFILNEENIIWSKDTGGKVPEAFPADPLKEGWKEE